MMRRVIILLSVIVVVIVGSVGLHYAWQLISIGVAYKAKVLCSGVFVSRRSPESVLNSDLLVDDLAILRRIDVEVDHQSQAVSSSFLRLINKAAAYNPGLGCTLVFPGYENKQQRLNDADIPPFDLERRVRLDEHVKADVAGHLERVLLESVMEWAFSEPDSEHLRRTRAVVIVHKRQIVGERYALGFKKNTPLIGWSMTKSVMNALVGIMVAQGKLSITDRGHVPEWKESNDGRSVITLNHLLQMSSGLDFDEDYTNPIADVAYMLTRVPDMATYAARKKLVAKPGSRWSYSSGTTNILSQVIRQVVGDSEYLSFPRRALFEPLGMSSAVIEPDASGTFVGSSFMYATAQDWAKFGLLYLQDGVWEGQRILPEGWVHYSTTPSPHAPEQMFGAHFWLKIPKEYSSSDEANLIPDDAFHAIGYEGQFITVIPSHDLVIVRLGLTRFASSWQHDVFVSKVLETIKN